MANNVVCTMNSSNGENTKGIIRSGTSDSSKLIGYLIKKNVPSGQFSVDTSMGSYITSYYRLVNPISYRIIGANGFPLDIQTITSYRNRLFVKLDSSWLDSTTMATIQEIEKKQKQVADTRAAAFAKAKEVQASLQAAREANSSGTSSGLDATYQNLMQYSYGRNDISGATRILGLPYHFTNDTDYRPFTDVGITLGRQFLNNIYAEAPIISLVPGIPSYLPDYSDEDKNAWSEFVSDGLNNTLTSDEAKEKFFSIGGRYFGFSAAFSKYIRYVNMLCRQASIYMGIGDKTVPIPGSSKTYKDFDWGNYTNVNYESNSNAKYGVFDSLDIATNDPETQNFITNMLESVDSIANELYSDYKYVKCYVDANASFSEGSSNNTTSSKIAGLFDTVEGLAKEINFVVEDSSILETVKEGINDIVGAGASVAESAEGTSATSNITKLLSSATHILDGSNVIFPDIWSDSKFDKSYSFSLNLISPYGDNESIFLNIMVPMMHMIAMSMPRQTSANTYGAPFLVKAFSKGWFSCEMGIISNIRIEKGGSGNSWNVWGLPTEVKIDISIADLYTSLMITSSNQPGLFFSNQGLIEFMAVTCGMDISTSNFMTKINSIISAYKRSVLDIPSNAYDILIENLRNKTEGMFKIGGF